MKLIPGSYPLDSRKIKNANCFEIAWIPNQSVLLWKKALSSGDLIIASTKNGNFDGIFNTKKSFPKPDFSHWLQPVRLEIDGSQGNNKVPGKIRNLGTVVMKNAFIIIFAVKQRKLP